MITQNTTLILGAGASAHVGYPLGSGLLSKLCSIRATKQYPPLPLQWTREDVDRLLLSLSRSGYSSIDAYLEFSPERELGKYLIAYQLKEFEDLDMLFRPHDPGWYEVLFKALISGCGADLSQNKVSIVTFNYDRSLEAYLHNVIQHRFNLESQSAWTCVAELPIVHVHGMLGEYPITEYQNHSTADELLTIADKIHIIHEIEDNSTGFCNSEFELAHGYLSNSDRIVFLGFGFHEDNVRRFNFFSPENLVDRDVYSTSSGMTGFEYKQMLESLKVYGLKDSLGDHTGQQCDGLFRNYLTL